MLTVPKSVIYYKCNWQRYIESANQKEVYNMMNDFNNFIEQINNCFTRNEANIKSDVIEYKDGYEILSDIPGVSKEMIKISFDESILNIEVSKKEDGGNADYKLCERNHAFANKTIYFDTDIDSTKAEAKYENGVLTVYLPKKPKKTTEIKID